MCRCSKKHVRMLPKQAKMLSRTKFANTRPDMFLNVWYLNSKHFFACKHMIDPIIGNYWNLHVSCVQKHFVYVFLLSFACKYHTCRYKFQTCICKSCMWMHKHLFACTHWKHAKTCLNLYLQVFCLQMKTCSNESCQIVACNYWSMQIQVQKRFCMFGNYMQKYVFACNSPKLVCASFANTCKF